MSKPSTALVTREHVQFERAALALIDAKNSPHTKDAYRRDLARWLRFCTTEQIDPTAPKLGATTTFRNYLVASLSNESARRVLASMSSVYRLLLRAGAVTANPFHPAVLAWPPATGLPKTRIVSDKDATAMIAHASADKNMLRGLRDAAILQMLYDTGLRRSSVVAILRKNYKDGAITTVVKGGKEAELVLPPASCAALDKWLSVAPESPYLFPGARGALNPATVNKLVKRRSSAVGAKKIHPHSFRAAFVTAGYDAGLPEREVQASVHHADPATTRRYDRHARGRMVATRVSEARKEREKK